MTLTFGRGLCALLCSGAIITACGGWVDLEPQASGGGASAAGNGASGNSGGGSDSYSGPFQILILTTALEYRHDSIIDCQRMLADLGQTPDDQMPAGTKPGSQFTTVIENDDLADFTASGLKGYGMLFWCSPTGTVFSDNPWVQNKASAMSALQKYVEGGGAWGGVHSATDFEKTGGFPWFTNSLVGGYLDKFDVDGTPGTVQVEASYADHPVMRNVPATWSVRDEWFRMNRDIGAQPGFQILARLASCSTGGCSADNRPAIWIKDFGTNAGRMFYTIRGHAPAVYREPEFRQLVLNGILWATHRLEK
ncbi:MAG: ThuA domain-containing protein [Polyangiaceae bacterium]